MTGATPGTVAVLPRSAGARARTGAEPVALLALPAALYLAVAFAVPLALLLVTSLVSDGRLTTAGYARFLGDPFSWTVMSNTLRVAALTTLVCLVAGYPAAFALARARGALRSALLAALVLPLSDIPAYERVFVGRSEDGGGSWGPAIPAAAVEGRKF